VSIKLARERGALLKYRLLLWLLGGLLQFMAITAHAQDAAGVVLFPSFSIHQQTGVLAGDQTVMDYDFRGGYRISSGFYFGIIYNTTTSSGSNTLNGSGFGNSVGYFNGMFSFIASFYFYGSVDEKTPTDSVTRSEAKGYQFDISYMIPLSASFALGPMLTYKSITYAKKQDATGVITNSAQPQTFVSPFLGLLLVF
jgi:hypothetical protein